MQFHDKGEIVGTRRTADGYLVADVRVARTGIQVYSGAEVGRTDLNIVRVWRPEKEVFDAASIRTYAHRPVTVGHPPKFVDAETWKEVAVGQLDGEVVRDGEFVRVPMTVMDAAAIAQIEDGDRQLSMGYTATIVFGDGVTPDGEAYDAMQTELRMNHLAIVAKARGGSELKIGDKTDGGADMADPKLRTIMVDGLSVETTDQGAQAIEKLTAMVGSFKDAAKAVATQHETAMAQKDAEIEVLKAKVLSDADRDALVEARAKFIAAARTLMPDIVVDGKPDAVIRREVVASKLGDAVIAGKSEAYIDARFDILMDEKPAHVDQFAQARQAQGGVHPGMSVADVAYSEMMERQSNAWRNGADTTVAKGA